MRRIYYYLLVAVNSSLVLTFLSLYVSHVHVKVGEGVPLLDEYSCLAQMFFSALYVATLQAERPELVVSESLKQLLILLALFL